MWPLRQALIPWYGSTMIQDAAGDPELMSHLLMGALHENRLHTMNALLKAEGVGPAFRHAEGFRFYLLYLLYQLAHANRGSELSSDQKAVPLLHVRLTLSANGELAKLQKSYEEMLAEMDKREKAGDGKQQGSEKWENMQQRYKSELYEPSAPPPASPPLQGPVETILNDGCLGPAGQAPWCPFVKRDLSPPLFALEPHKPLAKVTQEPSLTPPHDGYVEEFLLWFVRLCRDELIYREASKASGTGAFTGASGAAGGGKRGGALAGRQAMLSGGGGGGAGASATTENLPPESQLPTFFEVIVNELSRYLMVDPAEASLKPIWLYAFQVLRPNDAPKT